MNRNQYLVGSVIVWVGILAGTAFVLQGSPYFAQLLPILGGGVVWFVVLVPGGLMTGGRGQPGQN
jgi:hypothetical protein